MLATCDPAQGLKRPSAPSARPPPRGFRARSPPPASTRSGASRAVDGGPRRGGVAAGALAPAPYAARRRDARRRCRGEARTACGETRAAPPDEAPAACASGAAPTSAPRPRRSAREIEQLLASGECAARRHLRRSPAPPAARAGWSPRRSRSAASPSAAPARPPSSAAPRSATRSPGCARIADPSDSAGGRPRADPAAGRAALGRPRALHDDRPPPQARHDLGGRGGAREPAAAAAVARPDPRVPEALPGGRRRARRAPRRRLRAPADRAHRLPPPRPLRRQPGDGGAARQPRAASPSSRLAGRGAAPTAPPATSSATWPPSPRRASASAARPSRRPRDAVLLAEPEQVKGMEFERVYLLGLDRGAPALGRRAGRRGSPTACSPRRPAAGRRRRRRAPRPPRLRRAVSRAPRRVLVLSYAEQARGVAGRPLAGLRGAREALGAPEETHAEELFGPAEGLHSTYRMLRDEVLEASWRAGAALSEMRLDTADDVNRAVARFFELLKLAALIQRPGERVRARGARRPQRAARPDRHAGAARGARALGARRLRRSARAATGPAAREQLASRGGARARGSSSRAAPAASRLSASDVDLYQTCPLKYKFARVFAIPQEPTINQRFGILVHNVLERYHARGAARVRRRRSGRRSAASTACSGSSRRGGGGPGFGFTDDELQYRDRAVAALARYYERHIAGAARPVWLERRFSFKIGEHTIGGRVDRVDRHPDGSYELIDYKTGAPKTPPSSPTTCRSRSTGSPPATPGTSRPPTAPTGTCSTTRRSRPAASPTRSSGSSAPSPRSPRGSSSQDFEPKPDFEICSWCDYRLICPASEA